MKKLFSIMLVVLMLTVCAISGSAAISNDEKAIIDALSKKITMASGKVVALPDKYINQAEDYLTKAELTKDQITEILGYIENAQTSVKKSNAPSLSEAEDAVKQEVIKEAQKAAEVINAKLSVQKTGTTGEQGNVTANYKVSLAFNNLSTVEGYTSGTTIELALSSDEITQTGAEGNMTVAVAASVIVLAAAAFVVAASRKKALNK